jgi:hypothetical protein
LARAAGRPQGARAGRRTGTGRRPLSAIAGNRLPGDGALGFWKALDEVFPGARHQRCWVHKVANVLNGFPKSMHPAVTADLREVEIARFGGGSGPNLAKSHAPAREGFPGAAGSDSLAASRMETLPMRPAKPDST